LRKQTTTLALQGGEGVSCCVKALSASSTCPNALTASQTIGFNFFSGSAVVGQFTAPTSGLYSITVTTSGSPPSSVTVSINNVPLIHFTNFPAAGSFGANAGDSIVVSMSWGYLYFGGTVNVTICPPLPPPSPQPLLSKLSKTPLLLVVGLLAIAGVALVLYPILRSSSP